MPMRSSASRVRDEVDSDGGTVQRNRQPDHEAAVRKRRSRPIDHAPRNSSNTSLRDMFEELTGSITAARVSLCIFCGSIICATWMSIVYWNGMTISFCAVMACLFSTLHWDGDIREQVIFGLAAIVGIIAGVSTLAIRAMSFEARRIGAVGTIVLVAVMCWYRQNHARRHWMSYWATTLLAASGAGSLFLWTMNARQSSTASDLVEDALGGVGGALCIAVYHEWVWWFVYSGLIKVD